MTVLEIKKEFMSLRNGILSDALRKTYSPRPYSVIFGLMVAQITEIARGIERDDSLARDLWEDKKVRESRLLAAYLFEPNTKDKAQARSLVASLQTPEEAEILTFRLLRRLPFAEDLAREYASSQNYLEQYTSELLCRHLGLQECLGKEEN